MSATKPLLLSFYIHSAFRSYVGKQAKPHGLEWGMNADSHVFFLPATVAEGDPAMPDLTHDSTRRGIVEAFNRWAFAKDLEFKETSDIKNIRVADDGKHIAVEWKDCSYIPWKVTQHDNMEELLKADPAANGGPSAEVWVNGVFAGKLEGPMSLYPIVMAVKRVTGPGTKLAYKRAEGCIRIEKYFRGMIRKDQVFEHVMDNLIALEDPEVLGPKALIGTATLPDWIMGGQLTSRLHVEETEDGSLKFTRPLYFDDVGTADRHFGLFKGRHDVKIAMVRKELDRLRLLAAIAHPVKQNQTLPIAVPKGTGSPQYASFSLPGSLPDILESSSSSSLVLLNETGGGADSHMQGDE